MSDDDRPEPFHAYPESPDLGRVDDLRRRMREGRSDDLKQSRVTRKVGKSARDLGAYTLIPSLMIAGPVVGFLVGRGVEKLWGGEPWGAVGGLLLGVVAAFREVFLLLKRKQEQDAAEKRRGDAGRD
ncbi:AtpZ/AtpI family protein [bacterium]|nr:AtpZ/AtpI family protein [bacterium]